MLKAQTKMNDDQLHLSESRQFLSTARVDGEILVARGLEDVPGLV